MNLTNLFKTTLVISLAVMVMVVAWPAQAQSPPKLDGRSIELSVGNGISPDLAANSLYAALIYVERDQIRLRTATSENGWVTGVTLGEGTAPKVLLSQAAPYNVAYAMWLDETARRIWFTQCSLEGNVSPVCADPTIVFQGDFIEADLVADNGGNFYIAWNVSNRVEISKLAAGETNWQFISTLAGSKVITEPTKPTLATSDNYLHLAVENQQGKYISYYRYPLQGDIQAWQTRATYSLNDFIAHTALRNPTLAINNNEVYLAWDAAREAYSDIEGGIEITVDTAFGLAMVNSTDEGDTWLGQPRFIITDGSTKENDSITDKRISKSALSDPRPVPDEEISLRPQLSNRGNGVSLVWQERLNTSCSFRRGLNGTSEVLYAEYADDSWQNQGILEASLSTYDIAPVVAIGPNGERHLAYMRANKPAFSDSNCGEGGLSEDYVIYYHGPFLKLANSSGGNENLPALTITKDAITSTIGDFITYTLKVANQGDGEATEVNVFDPIPNGTTYLRGGNYNESLRQVEWSLGTLSPNSSVRILSFTVRIDQRIDITNQNYRVTASGGYNATGEPVITTEGDLGGVPSLRIRKFSIPGEVAVGEIITYSLTVENKGNAPATDVVVRDELPVGATYVNGGTLNGNTVTWNLPILPKDGVTVVTFTVVAEQTITNTTYRADATGGFSVVGTAPVVTIVRSNGGCDTAEPDCESIPTRYLPILMRQ